MKIPKIACGAVLLCLTACASDGAFEKNQERLAESVALLSERNLEGLDTEMNSLLEETQESVSTYALQRFFASWLLTQAHARAALLGPFRLEKTRAKSRIGAIGERGESIQERPNRNGHLVASVYHATQARQLFDRAARSGPTRDGSQLVPDQLWEFGIDLADSNLQVVLATTYFRLGFKSEVNKTLDSSPELLRVDSCLEALQRYHVPTELFPWVALMVFDYLKDRDEETAYRFGIVAIEGSQRFGQALPREEITPIEDWILNGASLQFVCPRSQTPYIPGETSSPLSGVPHYEYVALERR